MSTELAEVTKAVAEFDRVAAGLGALQKTYGGVVYEVATTQGMIAAKEARLAIREPRFGIEKIRKDAKAPLLSLGRKLDSEAARITEALLKIEEPIDRQIKNEEERKEREKQARIDAEIKRVADIQERIAELRGAVTAAANCKADLILEHIGDLEKIPVNASFEEFEAQAMDAKTATLARLREMHAARVAQDAEQARIKAEREELAKLRAEQEARDKAERARIAEEERVAREARAAAIAAQAEINRAERERMAAQQAELDRQAREQREHQEAEDKRLREEREALSSAQEALRLAQAPKPKPKTRKVPTSAEIVAVLAAHYQVTDSVVEKWLAGISWTAAA